MNLLANWKKVSADVSTTEFDWTAANYYKAGEDVADILVLSVGPITETVPLVDFLTRAKGLLYDAGCREACINLILMSPEDRTAEIGYECGCNDSIYIQIYDDDYDMSVFK